MAKLRKFKSYRALERPYTRISKYRKKAYVRSNFTTKITRFDMGNLQKDFDTSIVLRSKTGIQIRDNALESARQVTLKVLEKKLGTPNFFFKVLKYPFHVLRENPLASGAGADRFSTGMQASFGKPIGMAVQIHPGDALYKVKVDKVNADTAKMALKKAATKLPNSYLVEFEQPKKQ